MQSTSTLERTSSSITGLCPRCGSHASLEQLSTDHEPMCAACNEDQARCDAAFSDLKAVLKSTLEAWAERWTRQGVDPVLLADLAADLGPLSPELGSSQQGKHECQSPR
jgi:hypothetical protein